MNFDSDEFYSDAARLAPPTPAEEPGGIRLDTGAFDPLYLPVAELAGCAAALGRDGMSVLGGCPAHGYRPLRALLSARISSPRGDKTSVVVTNGAAQAVWLALRALIGPGDAAIVEEPGSTRAADAIRSLGASPVPVPCGPDGLDTEALAEAVESARDDGRQVRVIVTAPDFQNPTGAVMSAASRSRLLELASSLGLIVIEDASRSQLRFGGEPQPSLLSLDEEGIVISAGSFDVAAGPGLRVGWASGPVQIVDRMAALNELAGGGASVVAQALAAEYIRQGCADTAAARVASAASKKLAAMTAALASSFPKGAVYSAPEGGAHVWVTVPGMNAERTAAEAAKRGALFAPGPRFCVTQGMCADCLRLSFTRASEGEIARGVAIAAESIRK